MTLPSGRQTPLFNAISRLQEMARFLELEEELQQFAEAAPQFVAKPQRFVTMWHTLGVVRT